MWKGSENAAGTKYPDIYTRIFSGLLAYTGGYSVAYWLIPDIRSLLTYTGIFGGLLAYTGIIWRLSTGKLRAFIAQLDGDDLVDRGCFVQMQRVMACLYKLCCDFWLADPF